MGVTKEELLSFRILEQKQRREQIPQQGYRREPGRQVTKGHQTKTAQPKTISQPISLFERKEKISSTELSVRSQQLPTAITRVGK